MGFAVICPLARRRMPHIPELSNMPGTQKTGGAVKRAAGSWG
jgi:hypothetical protein